jgi:hypothetical protein
MEFLKFTLVISVGLGLTWAAGVVVPVPHVEDTSRVVVAQAETAPNSTEVDDTEISPDSEDMEVELDEMTQEDIDAELAKIEAALESGEELKEFKPAEPLPADLRLDLPSDI